MENDIPGLLMIYFMIGINVFVIPCPLVHSFFDLNPVMVIMNHLVLPDAKHRSLNTILTTELFAMFINLILIYMIFKYLFIILVYLIILGLQFKQYTKTLLLHIRNYSDPEIISFYMIVTVVLMIIRDFMCQQILYGLTFVQVMLTLFAWLSINAFNSLPLFIIAATIAAFAGGIGIVIFLLRILLFARLYSKQLVTQKRKRWTMHANRKRTYYFTVKWKAQMELQLTCGQQFSINEYAVNNYLFVLTSNITNAILLITP